MSRSTKKSIFLSIRLLIIATGLLISMYLIKIINDMGVIPKKYYLLGIIGISVLNILGIVFILIRKRIWKFISN